MHWEESDNQSFLWSGNPSSSVVVEGTAKPSYSRPGAMALSRGNFVSYLKAACPTLNNWDWFVWSSLLCCLLSLLTTKIWTKEENIFFFEKITTKNSFTEAHWQKGVSFFQKQNYPWDSTLTFSPNVLRNGRHCYFCPSRSADAETSFCKTGFSQPWAYNLSSMVLQHSNYSANAGFGCRLWNITHPQI